MIQSLSLIFYCEKYKLLCLMAFLCLTFHSKPELILMLLLIFCW